ncbi:unnamed protein product, partial [Mycena citricolor]
KSASAEPALTLHSKSRSCARHKAVHLAVTALYQMSTTQYTTSTRLLTTCRAYTSHHGGTIGRRNVEGHGHVESTKGTLALFHGLINAFAST